MSNEKKFDQMDVADQMTEEQREELKKAITDQSTKLGEVFSQCWESEEFKQAFIEDPKAIFEEYEITYNKDMDYEIIDTPDKTLVHVLPYGRVKPAVKAFSDRLLGLVEDIDDDAEKQILLDGWSWQIYQNTDSKSYIPLPISPEKLSPEELEMVNGGCLLFALVALFVSVVEESAAVTSSILVAELADMVVVAADVLLAVATVAALVTATFQITNAVMLNFHFAYAADSGDTNLSPWGDDKKWSL